MSEIYAAIMRAKANMPQPAKKKKAMYGKYADLDAVLDAVEKPLADEGVLITQSVFSGENGPYLNTQLTHVESESAIKSEYPIRAKNLDDPQQFGGSVTYARRYALSSMLSIVADEDDDGNTSSGKESNGNKKPAPKKPKQEVSQKKIEETFSEEGGLPEDQVEKLVTGYKRVGFDDNEILPEIRALVDHDLAQLSQLTEAELKAAMGHARKVKSGDTERLT